MRPFGHLIRDAEVLPRGAAWPMPKFGGGGRRVDYGSVLHVCVVCEAGIVCTLILFCTGPIVYCVLFICSVVLALHHPVHSSEVVRCSSRFIVTVSLSFIFAGACD